MESCNFSITRINTGVIREDNGFGARFVTEGQSVVIRRLEGVITAIREVFRGLRATCPDNFWRELTGRRFAG